MCRDDEFLGRATVQTSVVAERGHIEGLWVDLEECESGKAKVSIKFSSHLPPVGPRPSSKDGSLSLQ